MNLPKCSKWSVWSGLEIEAEGDDVGMPTLFVRRQWNPNTSKADADLIGHRKSVWFCADFCLFEKNYLEIVEWAVMNTPLVVLELTVDNWNKYPQTLRRRCRNYFVVPDELKQTDYIKVGKDYFQTCLKLRKLKPTVKPVDYEEDEVLKL